MAGRPSSYKIEYAEQAAKLCKLGATVAELADFFNVSDRTIYGWQTAHPDFLQALKNGKEAADERVEQSLYHRACGYTYDSEKIFQVDGEPLRVQTRTHVPPDVTACIFWLKNRRREQWRDVKDHDHSVRFDDLTDEQIDARLAALVAGGTEARGGGASGGEGPEGGAEPSGGVSSVH